MAARRLSMGQRYSLPRDRSSRDRLQQSLDRYGRSIEDVLYDFGIDPHNFSHRILDLEEFGYNGPIQPHRGVLPRGTGGRVHEYYDSHENHSPRGRTMANPTSGLPIGKAMKSLHKQIIRSEEVYNNFMSDYENEVASIKKYCPPEMLKKLWVAKMVGLKRTGDDIDDRTDSDCDGYMEKFAMQKETLEISLKEAVSSVVKDVGVTRRNEEQHEKVARGDQARRLLQKVSVYKSQLSELLEDAPMREQSCKDLLIELGTLRALVDPGAEMNRELYRVGGCDEGDNEGESENSGGQRLWEA